MCPQMDQNIIKPWSPTSWQSRVAGHQPLYADDKRLEEVLRTLGKLPQIVTWGEIERLKAQFGEAARGERFVLQGGDCAERFIDCTPHAIADKLKILLQMSLVLVHGLQKRVVRVGRIAGQYAKPRSTETETRDGLTLPSYRGDLINRPDFSAQDREPDPELMLRGYERAAMTLNYVRALVNGGFADLHHPEYWDLDFVRESPLESDYRQILRHVLDSLGFMETVAGRPWDESDRVDFYTSHEGLHLPYEQALTGFVEEAGRWYNLSTHFPWIGMRTAHVDGAHVEYFRGVANPVGVKLGPSMDANEISRLVETLNPSNEPGRLTLIHRFGADHVERCLPVAIEAVRQTGIEVLWICDPMHGNTETTANGLKTRRFERILAELEASFRIHSEHSSVLGGVHFELTADDVTECTGGARGLTESDLERAYLSEVDPRLNYEQALEMVMRLVSLAGVER